MQMCMCLLRLLYLAYEMVEAKHPVCIEQLLETFFVCLSRSLTLSGLSNNFEATHSNLGTCRPATGSLQLSLKRAGTTYIPSSTLMLNCARISMAT